MHCKSPLDPANATRSTRPDAESDTWRDETIVEEVFEDRQNRGNAHADRIHDWAARCLSGRACPSALMLGEYHLGLVEVPQEARIGLHLITCAHCAKEVAMLKQFLHEIDSITGPAFRPQADPEEQHPQG